MYNSDRPKSTSSDLTMITDHREVNELLWSHHIWDLNDQQRLLEAFYNRNLQILKPLDMGRKVAKVRVSNKKYVGIIVGKSGELHGCSSVCDRKAPSVR